MRLIIDQKRAPFDANKFTQLFLIFAEMINWCLVDWLFGCLVAWFFGWLAGLLDSGLVGGLVGCLFGLFLVGLLLE